MMNRDQNIMTVKSKGKDQGNFDFFLHEHWFIWLNLYLYTYYELSEPTANP